MYVKFHVQAFDLAAQTGVHSVEYIGTGALANHRLVSGYFVALNSTLRAARVEGDVDPRSLIERICWSERAGPRPQCICRTDRRVAVGARQ